VAPTGELVRRAGRSRVRRKKGVIERLYTQPPEGSVVLNLDEMGPQSPKSTPGQQLVHAAPGGGPDGQQRPAERAKQEVETGRREKGGYVFGAFRPATGEAFTRPYDKRNGANWVDFLEHVEAWVPAEVGRVDAILDNLPTHRTTDVLQFALWHPPLGVRLPAEVCGVPEPDRAMVEGAAESGAEGAEVQDVGGGVPGGRGGHGLLEQASPSVRLGSPSASPAAT
jgi:hypothetical protein